MGSAPFLSLQAWSSQGLPLKSQPKHFMDHLPVQLPSLHMYEKRFPSGLDLQLMVILLEVALLPLLCCDVLQVTTGIWLLKIPVPSGPALQPCAWMQGLGSTLCRLHPGALLGAVLQS